MTSTYTIDDGVAIVTLDHPPVNALSETLCAQLCTGIMDAGADPAVRAIVIVGAGSMFSAGADLKAQTLQGAKTLRDVIETIHASRIPVVAAIHGRALGGGLELALACHYRVALKDAQMGLPEVKLGLLPGGGGTQRLTRLVGIARALELIVNGTIFNASRALDDGVVDHIEEGDIRAIGVAFARRKAAARDTHPIIDSIQVAKDDEAIAAARADAARRFRGQEAPIACIDCIEQVTHPDAKAALLYERERFYQLKAGTQHAALKHLFFATRAAAKPEGVTPDVPLRSVATIGVIGAGTMGRGIAMSFANAGLPVVLVEANAEALERGLADIRQTYERSRKSGKLSEAQAAKRARLITPGASLEALGEVDLVVEAVFEDMTLKIDIFSKLDTICKPGAILATNTSGLDVNVIAAATSRAHDVIGLHFFSPAHVMKLLEIVRGEKTSIDVLATSLDLARRMGKVPVVVGVCDGFVGNRMVRPYGREADFMLEEGASVDRIDGVLEKFGLAMGRFRMSDLAGLDIGWAARKAQAALRPAHVRYSDMRDRLCDLGRFGQKSGAGYYRYEPGNRQAIVDPLTDEVAKEAAAASGIERRDISDQEILERTIYALVNEGACLLEEGMVERAGDIDVIYTNGYGFPAWRGGPMFYADTVGLPKVLSVIQDLHARFGDVWRPAPLLERLVAAGKSFNDPV